MHMLANLTLDSFPQIPSTLRVAPKDACKRTRDSTYRISSGPGEGQQVFQGSWHLRGQIGLSMCLQGGEQVVAWIQDRVVGWSYCQWVAKPDSLNLPPVDESFQVTKRGRSSGESLCAWSMQRIGLLPGMMVWTILHVRTRYMAPSVSSINPYTHTPTAIDSAPEISPM